MSDNLIPVNTMGYYDEKIKQWVPIDAVALKTHDVRYTAYDIKNAISDIQDRGINVKYLGAKGDNKNDDTQYIQDAFNYAKTLGNVKVIIPDGVYRVTSTLRFYKNTDIVMGKKATILRCHDGDIIVNGDPGDNFSEYNGNGNISIEGGIFDGNIKEFPTGYVSMGIARANNFIINNTVFKDVLSGHAIDINACKNVLITNSKFLGYKDVSVNKSRYFSEAIQISNHTYDGFKDFGQYDGTPCKNITVKNCYFGNSNTEGMEPWATGVGNHFAVNGVYTSNITVEGNTFEQMTYAGVRIFKFIDTIVSGNHFVKCRRGISISSTSATTSENPDGSKPNIPQAGKNILITGNTFNDTIGENIYGSGQVSGNNIAKIEGLIISNNTFNNQSPDQNISNISLYWVHNLTITNNILKKAFRGIGLNFASNVMINSNLFEDIRREFLYVNESNDLYRFKGYTSNITVDSNTINRCGRNGIFMQYAVGFDISNNKIFSPSLESSSRCGIYVSTRSKNGTIINNDVIKSTSGNINPYGVQVTYTCYDVRVFNNNLQSSQKNVWIHEYPANNNFQGYYINGQGDTVYRIKLDYSSGEMKAHKKLMDIYNKLNNENTSITIVGDSIAAGYKTANYAVDGKTIFTDTDGTSYNQPNLINGGWASEFNTYLKENYPNATIDNFSISGKSAKWFNQKKELIFKKSSYDVIILSVGSNDIWDCKTPDELKSNLIELSTYLKSKSSYLLLLCEPPRTLSAESQTYVNFSLSDVNEVYKEVSSDLQLDLVDYYSFLKGYVQFKQLDLDSMFYDGVHPNGSTHFILWNYLASQLEFTYTPSGSAETNDDE
ncbi:GDSL-type esterase/lipase family protein [Bacillus inaquosorum]|uniref:GDSL-type esterase/lipase family protein n=1 Tax=Bacillus inaquosorum TaxID=483913 RepID=UPI002280A381|nr:GDSL-type esterase/lipase family protein [Bacillus inaquosorum]MCY8282765.1 GDSL-type esterase/lipase family protein [Bacillus inaquosorum]